MEERQNIIYPVSWSLGAEQPNLPVRMGEVDGRVPIPVRLFEITVALAVLTLTLPVIAVMALIVRLDSRGPVLFRQKRVGRNLNCFKFVKFRTLYADARIRFPGLYDYQFTDDEIQGFTFKVENDPRVTRCGRWMRKTTLDELPNFWNVLKGEVALVGPRPEIPEMLPYYKGEMLRKFSVRPGITGLAQVRGRGRLSFYDTVKYDLEYVKNRSFLLDLKILFETIWVIIKRDGAY